ncbi:hypothetical protein LX81_00620 [Palleronia aestuarii]|uniref:Uncharacterized protein n=1 Tax=Palleronia aestuarii TaxID=568105 RepID=A0A2W7P0D6_9RHOB|nr:hypothetical protein LX81_00620 [Palleronia aestuarii]
MASLFAAVAVSSVVVMLGASRLEIATRQSEAPAEDTAASTPPVDEADGSIDAVSVLTIPEADPVQDPVQTIPDDIVPELRESLPPGIPPVPRPARGPAPEGSAQMDGAPPRPGADIPAARSTGDAPAADLNVTPSQEIDRAIEEAETAALAPPAGREQRATDLTDPNIASRLASIPDLDRYRVRLVSGDQEVFSQLEETLMGYGVGDVERRSTSIAPRKNVVRYFREEDAEFAALLAGLLEAEPQNLETFRPRPASGEIEIWLAGS